MANFWETKSLQEMSKDEWESLCDNCGKCCLHKLEDEESGKVYYTSVVCNLIDLETCRCTDYQRRCERVPDCLDLKQHDFKDYNWLPTTCAYRLLIDGKSLPGWHPLLTGDPESVHEAGISIRSYAMKEEEVDDLEDHIIEWRI